MKRKLKQELENDFFLVHTSIVYGVLKRCNLWQDHPDYDDFVQIGLLKLVESYESYPEDLFSEKGFYSFTGYAFQKIRWAILDELRKQSRMMDREVSLPEDLETWKVASETDKEEWAIWELLPDMLGQLNPHEQNYLKSAVLENLSVTDIAKKYGVSRKTVYDWKNKVAVKLADYKELLRRN